MPLAPPPEVIEAPTLDDVLAIMTRAVFQTGVSWAQIANHWDAYLRAFDRFDVARVARYGEADIERILAEPGILRMRRKIRATIDNACALLALVESHGSFEAYARSFGSYARLAKDLKRRFSFMGDMNAWYLLFRSNQPVPRFEAWVATIPGDHPRMREMVELARASGRSPEVDSAAAVE